MKCNACISKDFARFKSTFDEWVSLNLDIHDLDPVMMQAVKQDNAVAADHLLQHRLPANQGYALEATRHKCRDVFGVLLHYGWDISQPTSELRPPVLG